MNILITGHRGFIGSVLFERLKEKHNLTGIDLVEGDDLINCELPKVDFDLIIHLAGLSGVRTSFKNPGGYWVNNIEVSRRLFETYPNTRILYASSSSQYEPELNPYAASKHILEKVASKHSDNIGMRFHTVYSDVPRKNMFFDLLLNNKLKYVTNHHRDFIHMNDVIDAIEILIDNPKEQGAIDIGTGEMINIQEIAPEYPLNTDTPLERQYTCADTERMNGLGWEPKYSIHDYLKKQGLK